MFTEFEAHELSALSEAEASAALMRGCRRLKGGDFVVRPHSKPVLAAVLQGLLDASEEAEAAGDYRLAYGHMRLSVAIAEELELESAPELRAALEAFKRGGAVLQ